MTANKHRIEGWKRGEGMEEDERTAGEVKEKKGKRRESCRWRKRR